MFTFTKSVVNPSYLGSRMKRFLAFCVDIFPINFLVIMIYRRFSDYDALMGSLLADPDNAELQAAIIPTMNNITMIGGGVYIIYCFLMEASVNQATFGKKLFGLKVISHEGEVLTPQEAFWRNAFKVLSHSLMSLGFFWILFDRQKRGWHDILGKTLVVDQSYESTIPEELMQQLEEIKEQPYRNTAETLSESNFNTLKEGNQSNLLYSANLSSEAFQLIKSENSNPKIRFQKYKQHLVDLLIESNKNIPGDLVWNNSTKGQKLLRVFSTFDHHATSTGLFSFLFHNSEFVFAMIDVLQTIEADRMIEDYKQVVGEFGHRMEIFTENRKTYEYPLTTDKEKQVAFDTAKASILSVDKIEQYYYDDEFQEYIYQKVCDYVETHPRMFI